MSVIVQGFRKPKSCQEWRNGKLISCPMLDSDDDCKLQEEKGANWDVQYHNCPLIRIKRKHGEIIDMASGEKLLDAENDTWNK